MTTETTVPSFLGGTPAGETPTKEQAREAAQLSLTTAQQALETARKSVEAAQQAKAAAQIVIDAAKPTIMMAEAAVMIAKAGLLRFGAVPKDKTGESASILEMVKKILAGAEKQMTVLEVSEALKEEGVENNPDNIKAYLSRWAKTGIIVAAEKANKFEPARYYAPPVPHGVPGFLSGKAPVTEQSTETEFPEEFPGREPLLEAGYTSPADLTGKTLEDLIAIPGIGKTTANKILAAV